MKRSTRDATPEWLNVKNPTLEPRISNTTWTCYLQYKLNMPHGIRRTFYSLAVVVCEHKPSLYSPPIITPSFDTLLTSSAACVLLSDCSPAPGAGWIPVSRFSIQGLWHSRSASRLLLNLFIAFHFPSKCFLAFCSSSVPISQALWKPCVYVVLMKEGKAEDHWQKGEYK